MLAILLLPERDCRTCTAHLQRERGCTTDTALPLRFDGEELRRCPRRPLLDDPEFFGEVFSKFRAYQKDLLPDEGALESQGYRYTTLMSVISQATDEGRAELDRAAARKRAKSKT